MKLLMILFLILSCTKKIDVNEKVLNLYSIVNIKGMDPANTNGVYQANEMGRVFEGLLEYHYLKRPYELIPNLAKSMPEVKDNGLTYTFKLREGVLFQDDLAFPGGKGRELVAQDFVYSFKRLADPLLPGLGFWAIDGKIKGLNEWRDKYKSAETVNYNEKIEGIQALDKYTLQFKLTKPFPQFLYTLAMTQSFVVAKEVVDKYGAEIINHPVGTGAYQVVSYEPNSKIVYEKNPTYRDKRFPSEGAEEFVKAGFLKYANKKLPLVDKVVSHIITEEHPRWLNFQKGNIDYIEIPKDNFDGSISPSKEVTNELKKKGILLDITPTLDVTYFAFNHDNKLLDNLNLRRAMSLSIDPNELNKLFYNDRALVAQSVIPAGIKGYDPNFKNPFIGPDIEQAKRLLVEAGYPGGKGIPVLTYDTASSTFYRQMGEYIKKRFALIGIELRVQNNPWPELLKKVDNRRIMLYTMAWQGDYPDAQNFLQLLYGPNRSPGSNGAGYNNPVYNELYERASVMQDSPVRTALYEKMNRMLGSELPWIFGVHRKMYHLHHGWLKNYAYSDFLSGTTKYLDVDLEIKKKLAKDL